MNRLVLSLSAVLLIALPAAPAHAQLFGGGRCGGVLGGLIGAIGGGCPIVESRPGMVEGMVAIQQAEILLQTAHMLTQIEQMIAMRRLSSLDTGAEIAARLGEARRVLDRVDRVLWDLGAVDAQFADLYPDLLPDGWSAAELTAHQHEQAALARATSHASKLAAADAVTAAAAYPDRVQAVRAALKACEGQTCATDAATQATLLEVEVSGQKLLLQAAHQRALEAQLDYERAAQERARQHARINWRDADRYGGR